MKDLAVNDRHPLLPNARGMAVAIATELWNDVTKNPGSKDQEETPTPTRAVVSEDGNSVLLMYDNDPEVNPFAGEEIPLES